MQHLHEMLIARRPAGEPIRSKAFFFEKKKQKTFDCWASAPPG
jgi:hypothetical protein